MTLARSSLALASLWPAVALLAACQSMPEVPFVNKKDTPAATGSDAGTASTTPSPAPAAPVALPEPPGSPAPAARTALVTTSYSVDGAVLPTVRGQQLVETRGDMRRTDALQRFDNRLLSAFAGERHSADIVRLDKKLVWTIDPAKKTYTECPLIGCRTAEPPSKDKPDADSRDNASAESCPLTLKKNELKATRTGERKTINSFNTERVELRWVMELADKQGRINRNQVLMDVWAAPETGVVKDVQALDRAFQARFVAALPAQEQALARYLPREVTGSLGLLMSRLGTDKKTTATWSRELHKVRGYPIHTTLTWSVEGNACAEGSAPSPAPTSLGAMVSGLNKLVGGNKAGASGGKGLLLTYTHEVKSMEVKAVSDTWFTPQPDFQKVQP